MVGHMKPKVLKKIKLSVISGPHKGDEFSFNSEKKVVIGRDKSTDITIKNDYLLSAIHCGIFFSEAGFVLEDFESSNGSLLNKKYVTKEVLNDDDNIRIGNTILHVRITTKSIDLKANSNVINNSVFSIESNHEDEQSSLINNQSQFRIKNVLWEDKHGRVGLTIIAKSTFKITPDSVKRSEKSIPIFTEDIFYDENIFGSIKFESDLAPHKPCSDIVIVGNAYAPNQRPVKAIDVGVMVGEKKNILRVYGDRKWSRIGNSSTYEISDPKPFKTMPLIYENAFGGGDFQRGKYCQKNHIGKGCITQESLSDIELQKLPNIEDPLNLVKSWKSNPDPVGFGFYRKDWSPRIQYAGTYDENYMKSGSIEPPDDFSYRLYNSAHPSMQVDGYLRGDEQVELVNLSKNGRLVFNLPNIKPEVVVQKKPFIDKKRKSQINMNLDTLVLIPDEEVFYQVFRGVYKLDSIVDIQNISILVI